MNMLVQTTQKNDSTLSRVMDDRYERCNGMIEDGYKSIAAARLERMRLLEDDEQCLLLQDHTNTFETSFKQTVTNTTSNQIQHIDNNVVEEDDVYEDDEDWVDIRDVAIQELKDRTTQLEQRLINQQEQHEIEISQLRSVVERFQVEKQQEENPSDPPLMSRHHRQYHEHNQQIQQQSRIIVQPNTVTQRLEQQFEQQFEQQQQLKAAEYERKIKQLEEDLSEMSRKISSHELQVVTDSSAVLTDMSLKLGEHIGENKFLKTRLAELTSEVKEIRSNVYQKKIQNSTPSIVTTPPEVAPLPSTPTTPPPSTPPPATIKENVHTPKTIAPLGGKNNNYNVRREEKKKEITSLKLVENMPIDDRIKLASKLRKLERIAVELLSSSTSTTKGSKKGRLRGNRRRNKMDSLFGDVHVQSL